MSIIVDTLEKIQSSRTSDSEFTTSDIDFDFLEEPSSENTGISKTKIVFGVIFLAIAVNVFLITQNKETSNPLDEESNQIGIINATDKIENASQNTIQQPVEQPSKEEEKLEAIKAEIAELKQKAAEQESEKIENEPESIAETEEINAEESITTDIDSTKTEEMATSEKQAESLEQNSDIESKPEPIVEEQLVLEKTTTLDWVMEGTKDFKTNGLLSAEKIWQNGFSQMDNDQPVVSIIVNRKPNSATNNLEQLIAKNINAFALKAAFKNAPAYFILTIPNKEEPQIFYPIVEKIIGGRPFATNKKYIQKQINALQSIKLDKQDTASPELTKAGKIKRDINTEPDKPALTLTQRIQLAEKAVLNGQYRIAKKRLQPLIWKNTKNWEVLFWMGSAKLGLGEFDQADELFQQALQIKSEIPQLWTQRAIIAQEKNDHKTALDYLTRAQQLSPKAPEITLNIAYSNDALGKVNAAVFAYREYLTLTENKPTYSSQRRAVATRLSNLGF